MGDFGKCRLPGAAVKLFCVFVLAMVCSAAGGFSRAYADASLEIAEAGDSAHPETEGLVAPYLKMDLGQLKDQGKLELSAPDGVTIQKADDSGVVVSGKASQLNGASVTLTDALEFNKPVGRICVDGLALTNVSAGVDVCFEDLTTSLANFTLRNQPETDTALIDGDLTHNALGMVPAGTQRVFLRLSVNDSTPDQGVRILLRSIEFVQSSLPTFYFNLDESEGDKPSGYGTLAEMLASRDHSVRCAGTVSLYVPNGFTIDNGGGEERCEEEGFNDVALEYVRGRGNSTWDEKRPKKPFKFKFAKGEKRGLFGMSENRHWVLLANSFDGSLVRDRLTSWIGNKIGLEYTYKSVPVDLVINEVFYGSYLLCEQVRVDKNRINIGNPVDTEDETGGYLLSRAIPKVGDPDAITTAQGVKMLVKSPSSVDAEAAEDEGQSGEAAKYHNYITNCVQSVEDALFGVDYKNAAGKSYANLVDVDSAVKYWWVQEFSKNNDAFVTGSSYYYKKSDGEGGKFYWGPLWDFDLAWGNDPFHNTKIDTSAAYVVNDRKDPWLDQLKGDPEFAGKLKQFWKDTFKGALAEVTRKDGLLDRYYKETLVSAYYDREKWGDAAYVDQSAIESGAKVASFKEEIDWLKWWIDRMASLTDKTVDELGSSRCTVTFVVDGKPTRQMSVIANETMTRVPDAPAKDGYVFIGWYLPSGAKAVPGSTVFARNTTLAARYVEAAKAVPATDVYFKNAHVYWPDNGEPFKPSYTIAPANAQECSITWSSSNTDVAMVNAGGEVSPYSIGTATITATLKSGASFSYEFEVLDRSDIGPASSPSISAEPSSLVIMEGSVGQIKAATNGRDTANEMLSFAPKNARIVKVDENGVVTGLKPGRTTVTVENPDNEIKTTCAVVVKPLDPSISGAKLVLSKTKFVYNGKVRQPKVKTVGGRDLEEGVDYTISWSAPKSKNAGTYRLSAVGKDLFTGTSVSATYKIVKARNPLKVKGKKVKLKASKLRGKSLSVAKRKAFKVKKKRSSGKLVFKKVSGNAKIKVSKRGKVTVKKGLRSGTYRVKVKVKQRASRNYKAKTIKRVTLKVKVA